MKKFLVVLTCLLVGLAVMLCGFLAYFIIGGGGSFSFGFSAKLANRQTVDAGALDEIELQYGSNKVIVVPTAGDEVVLEEYMNTNDPARFATLTQNGGRLLVEQGERSIDILFGYSYVKLYLPREWNGALAVETGSGGVELEDTLALESLRVKSTSGGVEYDTLKVEKDLVVEVGSGGIRGESAEAGGDMALSTTSGGVRPGRARAANIRAESGSGGVAFEEAVGATVEASSNSGSVRFDRIEGRFTLESGSGTIEVEGGAGGGVAKTNSGSVRVALHEPTEDMDLRSGSGSVRVTLPEYTPLAFTAKTGSGSIRTPFDNALSFSQKGNEASGAYGDGAALALGCQTGSGSIRVEWL